MSKQLISQELSHAHRLPVGPELDFSALPGIKDLRAGFFKTLQDRRIRMPREVIQGDAIDICRR
jgi:hypothetical protein